MTTTNDESARDAVKTLLAYLGEDTTREGLLDTPKRVAKALKEMTMGYQQNPSDILGTIFESEDYEQMVILSNIEFTSLCEHHMLPFIGVAHIGYLPAGKVVGLSKLARLVECFSRRLQIQEKMTVEIAESLRSALQCPGAGVVIEAHHQCMSCRGVRKQNTVMSTSHLVGLFKEPHVKSEFFKLIRRPGK